MGPVLFKLAHHICNCSEHPESEKLELLPPFDQREPSAGSESVNQKMLHLALVFKNGGHQRI